MIKKVNADVDNIIEDLRKSNKKIYNLFINWNKVFFGLQK